MDWTRDAQTGKEYAVVKTPTFNYDVNKQICESNGAILPEPRDEQENSFLVDLNTDMFLLGMTDQVSEGQWVWNSDGSPVTWYNWVSWPGEATRPNGGTRENCMFVIRHYREDVSGHDSRTWEDHKCESEAALEAMPKSLICQKKYGMYWRILFTPLNPDLLSLSDLEYGAPGRIVDLRSKQTNKQTNRLL